jgi:Xaa-Pro aminopeptidase
MKLMLIRSLLVALFAAAPACAQVGAAPERFVPSKGWPYGERGVHGSAANPREFARHREAFLAYLEEQGEGTVAIVRSAPNAPRNGDVEHEYRQDSDFYWLTGFPEESSTAIFEPGATESASSDGFVEASGGRPPVYTLLVLPRNPSQEIWTGRRIGPEGAVREYGADRAADREKADAVVKEAIGRAKTLVVVNGFDRAFRESVDRTVRELQEQGRGPEKVVDGSRWVGARRNVKSPEEIEMLRRAIEVTMEGILHAMATARPGMNEGAAEAAAEYAFRALGSPRLGFPTICGAGRNSCILHYVTNDAWIGEDDLVLMDAGAEVGYFTADITRTWPVSGRFTPEQRAIYEIVYRAQEAGIEAVKPGVPFGDVHQASAIEVTRGLVALGLLEGDPEELVRTRAHRKFFMHGTSHWLGLDVHDTGGRSRVLEPGMVLTVEPGIYIAEGTEGVDPKWWGIGVRIEDDVLVTESGREVLSARLPREPNALEAFLQESRR